MLISIDWIKDFVEVPEDLSSEEIANRFTMATAEVEGVESFGDHFEKIHIVEITEIEKHPEADKLNLVTFNTGSGTKQVVCGGQNVRVGLRVPYAPLGTTLPCGLVLEPKKIRGILSEGMLCSADELGYSNEVDGILELPDDAPLGKNLIEYYNEKKDVILDVDNKSLTHRPDLWGMFGIAREFATIFQKPLTNRFTRDWKNALKEKFTDEKSPVVPRLEGESAGLGYYGLSIDNVKVDESPDWMKRRLNAVGLRPINNIVDISNYVMLELGMPLHIFDRDLIKGNEVIIKRVGEETTFKTLDEIDRKLIPTDTVICDETGPLVLGGIMGGLSSGVNDKTNKIFIEVANWKASEVRKTSTRLGLRTDSSMRYEKTLDSHLMARTLYRTLELVLELCPDAKIVGKLEYDGEDLSHPHKPLIPTSVKKIEKVLGKELGEKTICDILASLDYAVEVKGEVLNVTVPTFRATKDVECEADIVEEIGRIVGYDHIVETAPLVTVKPTNLSPSQKIHRKIRDFMVYKANALEVMTYPMVGKKMLQKANWPVSDELKLLNALSEDADRMRPSLVPSMLQTIALNQKNYSSFRFFEIGQAYHRCDKNFSNQENHVVLCSFDKTENQFVAIANAVQQLCETLNLPYEFQAPHPKFKNTLIPEEWIGEHPYEQYDIKVMGKVVGVIRSAHPLILRQYKAKGCASYAVINLSSFESREMKDKTKYKPLAKFPSSTFDWTVVVSKETKVEEVLAVLKKVRIKEMVSCKVADIFDREDGNIAVTLRATFLDPEKTLDGELLESSYSKLVDACEKAGYPLKS